MSKFLMMFVVLTGLLNIQVLFGDNRIEWTHQNVTYVLLKDEGNIHFSDLNRICTSAGLVPVRSHVDPKGCLNSGKDVITCLAILGKPLADLVVELSKSPIWSALPLNTSGLETVVGVWFAPTYSWITNKYGTLRFRFLASQKLTAEVLPAKLLIKTLSSEPANDKDVNDRYAVLCRK